LHYISFENKCKISLRFLASFKEGHEQILKGTSKLYYDLSSPITEKVYMTLGSVVWLG
jgi:hypothetical protein